MSPQLSDPQFGGNCTTLFSPKSSALGPAKITDGRNFERSDQEARRAATIVARGRATNGSENPWYDVLVMPSPSRLRHPIGIKRLIGRGIKGVGIQKAGSLILGLGFPFHRKQRGTREVPRYSQWNKPPLSRQRSFECVRPLPLSSPSTRHSAWPGSDRGAPFS
jgi:hypothetical protein